MDANLVSLSGQLTAQGHVLTQRVYYEDTDFSGVVYHARYLHFLERGRTDFIRMLGIEQGRMANPDQGEGLAFVVHRMEIDFKSPARMDDILTIVTRTERAQGVKLVLLQEIACGGKSLIQAKVDIVTVNGQGRPRRLPVEIASALSAFPVS